MGKKILFKVANPTEGTDDTNKDVVYLINNDWDDWFEFETVYVVKYRGCYIGRTRIGRKNQTERRASLESCFYELPKDFFSLGVNVDYYSNLKKYPQKRSEILQALHDMAFDLSLLQENASERVTTVSLLRDLSISTVRGQLHRIADGGAELTDYDFKYIMPDINVNTGENNYIDFKVDANNNLPASNIHVLIGNNGIGKTTLIRNMLGVLLRNDNGYGKIETGWGENFANIVNISFSAFDSPICQLDAEKSSIPYTYIGLVQARMEDGKRKLYAQSYDSLTDVFLDHYHTIIRSTTKKELWKRAISLLETDSTFSELNILGWLVKDDERFSEIRNTLKQEDNETDIQYKIRIDREYLRKVVGEAFRQYSSGHKNILLTMVGLIDKVEEKTLVILDEPEEHLHPPLVAAFIRALSDLLKYRNGVAIIATHSPVIVQEVPKKCVWKIRRNGKYVSYERPLIETFGENIGELTTEIFSYDLQNTGFHNVLKEVANSKSSYERALRAFHGELGNEAKSILRAYMYEKED